MNSASRKPVDVFSIKRLDTAALGRLRAAVQPAPRIASGSAAPAAVIVSRAAPASGRRLATATFALGLLLGVLSTQLGEPRSTQPSFAPLATPPAAVAADLVGASAVSPDALPAAPAPALAERPPTSGASASAQPARRHHGT